MKLTCPRCSTSFETGAPTGSTVDCPHCSARLQIRKRRQAAAAASVGAGASAPGAGTDSSTPSGGYQAVDGPGTSDIPQQSPAPQEEAPPERKAAPRSLAPGTRLGGFEIQKLLGRGGMATVYRGTQLSLNRPVAVKVLASRFARNPSFIDRFDREAGALANLSHPNIVNIIDKGVVGTHYFFVMELVDGITLDQLIHSVPLTETHYTHVIGEIGKALSYIHSRGVVHRDIKPSNILVTRQGVVKLSDFGIAFLATGGTGEVAKRKATVGTANYMAPEQASNPAAIDDRADIYSLGVTFYKMFTKRLPGKEYKPASQLNPALPRTIDTVLLRALQENPDDRYATVKEFCDALNQSFKPAGSQDAGADAAHEPFMFNPGLLSGTAIQPGTRDRTSAGDSSAASGASEISGSKLFVPWASATDSGFAGRLAAPGESPVPRRAAPPAPPAIQDADPPAKARMWSFVLLALVCLLVIGGGLGFLAFYYLGYIH